jgi:DICT domain-containing protein
MLEGSILQQLETAHRHTTRPIRFGVYYKNTLVALCHALEDHILTDDGTPLVITAFQRGKWYLQEAGRYADIAQRSREIAIMAASESGFAEHPTSQLPNVDLVAIDPVDLKSASFASWLTPPTKILLVRSCSSRGMARLGSIILPSK